MKLIYFNYLAYAEPIKMIMNYGNIPYEFIFPWDYFGTEKWSDSKKDVPFGKLPILVIDENTTLWESGAIMRYLSRKTNTIPEDEILKAKADAVFDNTKDFVYPIDATFGACIDEEFQECKKELINNLPDLIRPFYNLLKENGPFLLSEKAYYCDFVFYHHMKLLKECSGELLDDYPKILDFIKAFEKLKGIKDYLNNRPTLIGIGKDPKLGHEGNYLPTGYWRD